MKKRILISVYNPDRTTKISYAVALDDLCPDDEIQVLIVNVQQPEEK